MNEFRSLNDWPWRTNVTGRKSEPLNRRDVEIMVVLSMISTRNGIDRNALDANDTGKSPVWAIDSQTYSASSTIISAWIGEPTNYGFPKTTAGPIHSSDSHTSDVIIACVICLAKAPHERLNKVRFVDGLTLQCNAECDVFSLFRNLITLNFQEKLPFFPSFAQRHWALPDNRYNWLCSMLEKQIDKFSFMNKFT